jgi:peptidoglycan/LPS O-acetylase OafA/YrhL
MSNRHTGALPAVSADHRIPSLDGLRALSIALVILKHQWQVLWPIDKSVVGTLVSEGGLTGVAIFFGISGFLITGLLIRERHKTGKISLFRFYVRRSLRILPPLYFFIVALAALTALGLIRVSVRDFIVASTFTWNYFGGSSWYLGHTWSLSIEEQFYLAWPTVIVFLGIMRARWCAIIIIVAEPAIRLATYYLLPSWRGYIEIMTHTRADALMFGCAAALFWGDTRFHDAMDWMDAKLLLIPAILFVFFAEPLLVARFRGTYLLTMGYSIQGLCILVILLSAVRHPGTFAGRVLNSPPVAFVGVLSYSIYLWQQLFFSPDNTTLTGRFPLNLMGAFGAAIFSYYAIEQPSLRWRNQLRGVQRDAVGATEGSAA